MPGARRPPGLIMAASQNDLGSRPGGGLNRLIGPSANEMSPRARAAQ